MRLLLSQGTLLTLVVVEAVLALHLEGVLAVDAGPAGGARTAANEGGGGRMNSWCLGSVKGCLRQGRLRDEFPFVGFNGYFTSAII